MSRRKSAAVKDIDIADILGQKYRYRQRRYQPTSKLYVCNRQHKYADSLKQNLLGERHYVTFALWYQPSVTLLHFNEID